MKNRKPFSIFFAAIGAAAIFALPRFAAAVTSEDAGGVITSKSLGAGNWQYDITLSNNSTADNADTTIGTFWFSWAPGQEYMEAVPTAVLAPTGWTAAITGTVGSGIQFVAMSGDLLHAGASLSGFQFDSTETPAQLAGPSSLFQHQAETTSAAYVGAPFSDTTTAGDVFSLTVQNTTPPGGGDVPPPNPGHPPTTGNTGDSSAGGPSAVPLPAASGQILAGLLGVALIAARKKSSLFLAPNAAE
jgi:hypothetical protein